MKTSIVLSTHAARFDAVAYKGDFAANVLKIAALGYDGVELAIRDPSLIDADALLSVVSTYGLHVPAIGTGQAWGEEGLSFTDPEERVREAAIRRLCDHIPFAARTGAVIIVGLLRGVIKPGVDRPQAMAWLTEALRRCATSAAPHGVSLVLEPINRYETDLTNRVDEALQLIDRVGADNLGVLFDTFHANIEEPSVTGSLRAAGDRLFHVHTADSNRWYPGAGHVDFAAVVRTLRDLGYAGWLSAEILPRPDPATATARAVEHLRQIAGEED